MSRAREAAADALRKAQPWNYGVKEAIGRVVDAFLASDDHDPADVARMAEITYGAGIRPYDFKQMVEVLIEAGVLVQHTWATKILTPEKLWVVNLPGNRQKPHEFVLSRDGEHEFCAYCAEPEDAPMHLPVENVESRVE